MVDQALFRTAMARTATGVAVVTTDGPGGRRGITVSSMCSLSLEPPSVLACVHKESSATRAIAINQVFCANVLADHQAKLSDVFAGRDPAFADDRFKVARWARLRTGSPVLERALVAFDCELAESVHYGTHEILIGRVVELTMGDARPLIYADRTYRRVG